MPTDQEREEALLRLREIQRRIQRGRDADAARERPIAARWVAGFFDKIAVDDPEGRIVRSIARHGLAVVTEAIALLRAKLSAGASFDRARRYLAGVAINLAHRNEHLALYDHAVELRLSALDELLAPLRNQDREWGADLEPDDCIDRVADAVLDEGPSTDSAFWPRQLVRALESFSRLLASVRTPRSSVSSPPPIELAKTCAAGNARTRDGDGGEGA